MLLAQPPIKCTTMSLTAPLIKSRLVGTVRKSEESSVHWSTECLNETEVTLGDLATVMAKIRAEAEVEIVDVEEVKEVVCV
jgi:hypothetical protein